MTQLRKRPAELPSVSKERLRSWLRLLRTSREIETELRERLRVNFATTMPRFDVLAALERAPRGLTMSALSEQLLVSNGNVTGIVERLVQDGLVVRTSDASDRRTTFVRMTPKGEQSFATMAQAHEGWVDELLGGLAPADFDALDGLLQRASPSHRKTET